MLCEIGIRLGHAGNRSSLPLILKFGFCHPRPGEDERDQERYRPRNRRRYEPPEMTALRPKHQNGQRHGRDDSQDDRRGDQRRIRCGNDRAVESQIA